MKKIFAIVLAAALFAGTNAFAQIYPGAGYINSTRTGQYNGSAENPVNSNGFYVGASYNVGLSGNLGVAPGLYLSMISHTNEAGVSGFGLSQNSKSTFTEMAINVPVMANYSYALARDAKVFAYAGPTFQLGLSSKTRTIDSGVLSADNTRDHYAQSDYNKFNVYVGGGIGAEFAKILVVLGYDYGLMNLYAGSTDNTFYHRSNLHIGVGYAF